MFRCWGEGGAEALSLICIYDDGIMGVGLVYFALNGTHMVHITYNLMTRKLIVEK